MSGQEAGVARLVVCDAHDDAWIGHAAARTRPGDEWHVLVLRVDARAYKRRHASALAALGPTVRILDVAALAPAVAREVSAFVLDLVWRLPGIVLRGRTLGELLRENGRNLWWSLEVSEKSSFRGLLIERLYRLALVQRVVADRTYHELWLQLGDDHLAQVIANARRLPPVTFGAPTRRRTGSAARFWGAYWGRALVALGRFLATRALIHACGFARQAQGRGELAIFTLYPYWWTRPYDSAARDRFYSEQPPATTYAAWLVWPAELWRRRHAVAATLNARRIFPLQRVVALRDAVRLLSPWRFAKVRGVARALRAFPATGFGAFDVAPLVAGEITASMQDAELFFDVLIERAMTRYTSRVAPRAVLYRVEGQPWENALLAGVRATGAPAVGFFHSPFGENYPALRFAPGELAGQGHGAGPRPLPDAMLTCGSTVRGYLEADGYPPERIATCGPQRHADFARFLHDRRTRAELRDRLNLPLSARLYFVAIAIVEAETEGLFTSLADAVPPGEDFRLLIKTHPNRPAGDESMQSAVRAIGADRVTYVPSGGNMYEYLAASDIMICIGSTVAFEAMALGVMPVVYEHPGTYPMTSLRAFQHALYVVNSPEAMKRALDEIETNADAAVMRRAAFGPTVEAVLGRFDAPLDTQLIGAVERLIGSEGPAATDSRIPIA